MVGLGAGNERGKCLDYLPWRAHATSFKSSPAVATGESVHRYQTVSLVFLDRGYLETGRQTLTSLQSSAYNYKVLVVNRSGSRFHESGRDGNPKAAGSRAAGSGWSDVIM